MQTNPCTICKGYPSPYNWVGIGPLCTGCFNDEYVRMNRDDEEFEEKQEKIKRNFEYVVRKNADN